VSTPSTPSTTSTTIVPITLTVNGRIGLTLWAPPWTDDDDEEWQGFLGDGAKILLYPNTKELADFIASGEENDLSDHPAWGRIQKLTPDELRPATDDAYDLDQVYEWASGEPDPVHVSSLANVVDMVSRIADCCDDGRLRRLVGNTPEYEELVSDEVSYQGKDGRKRWNQLGDVIAETWERALARVDSWLSWQGEFADADLDQETSWDRLGAEPIELVVTDGRYLTVRAESADGRASFLGRAGTDEATGHVEVFESVADLAAYCRGPEPAPLNELTGWDELTDEPDSAFQPALDASYDLREQSPLSAGLVRDLIIFCGLDADPDDVANLDRTEWAELQTEVEACLQAS
jgi:hypothetical protein